MASIRRIAYDTGKPPAKADTNDPSQYARRRDISIAKASQHVFRQSQVNLYATPKQSKINLDHMAASSVNGVLRPSEATNYADKQLMGLSY